MVTAPASPPGADPDWPADAVEVGRVVEAWGLKGGIRVRPFASDPQALFGSRRWFLLPSERAVPLRPGAARLPTRLKITQAREQGDAIVATAQEVQDRDAAEALRGARIFVARSSFPSAGADEFYWVDLIGMGVVNRQGEALGRVVGLIDTGAHSVLRVAPEGAVAGDPASAERLIPFVGAYIDEVSLERRTIAVDWGLDY